MTLITKVTVKVVLMTIITKIRITVAITEKKQQQQYSYPSDNNTATQVTKSHPSRQNQ